MIDDYPTPIGYMDKERSFKDIFDYEEKETKDEREVENKDD